MTIALEHFNEYKELQWKLWRQNTDKLNWVIRQGDPRQEERKAGTLRAPEWLGEGWLCDKKINCTDGERTTTVICMRVCAPLGSDLDPSTTQSCVLFKAWFNIHLPEGTNRFYRCTFQEDLVGLLYTCRRTDVRAEIFKMSDPSNNLESANVGSGDFPKGVRTGERRVCGGGRAWLIQGIKMLMQAMKRMAQVV